MNMKCLCFFFWLSHFIKRARMNPPAGRFWPTARMFDTPDIDRRPESRVRRRHIYLWENKKDKKNKKDNNTLRVT